MSTPEIEIKVIPETDPDSGEEIIVEETPVKKVEEVAAIVEAVAALVPEGETEALKTEINHLHEKLNHAHERIDALTNDLGILAASIVVKEVEEIIAEPAPEGEVIIEGDLPIEEIPEPAKEPELRTVKKSRFIY